MATLKGTEEKYLMMVLQHISDNKTIKIGPDGKADEIKVLYSPLLKRIHKTKDLKKAMNLMKRGNTFLPVFISKDSKDKTYKWTEIYKGTFSGFSRKNSTSASNVNEVFTLFFLKNKEMTLGEVIDYLNNNLSKYTGIKKGDGVLIKNKDLLDLIISDDSAEADIKIAVNNAEAVLKDIKGKTISEYYWCPRQKPDGVPSSHPADIVIKFSDKTSLGYSNKAISGTKDETPKFNTSVTAFYSEEKKYQKEINKMIDDSWIEVQEKLPEVLQNIMPDIKKEPYTEGGSKMLFKEISEKFKEINLDFYKDDFYYPFRNTFISKFTDYLSKDKNLEALLNIIYTYTYTTAADKLSYKLLVGSPQKSIITEVSTNEQLKSILSAKELQNKKITYDKKSQSFKCEAKHKNTSFYFNVTCRTRSSGGWSGKSLYMTTPGIKVK